MTVREYIGARYAPIFIGLWDNTQTYEPLSIVQYQGNSFTSRQYVPIGIDINNEEYWVETGTYNAQIEAYRQEVFTFNDRLDGVDDRLDDAESDISLIQNDVEDLQKKTCCLTKVSIAYLNGQNGNDETAIMDDSTKPFKTLDAAIKACSDLGNHIYIRFMTPGNYIMNYRLFNGCTIHFVLDPNSQISGVINISVPNNNPGGVYLYDTHINCSGNENCKFHLNFDGRLFQEEGSTIYFQYVEVTCNYLNLVQGSTHFNHTTINGYIRSFFAFMRVQAETIINNQSPVIAMYLYQTNLRVEGDVLEIKANTSDVSQLEAMQIISGDILWNAATYSGDSPNNYKYFIDTRGATLRMSDDFQTLLDACCTSPSVTTSITLRLKTTVILPS